LLTVERAWVITLSFVIAAFAYTSLGLRCAQDDNFFLRMADCTQSDNFKNFSTSNIA
jgi:hypothetical protein